MDERRFWSLIDETRPEAARRGLFRRRATAPDLESHRQRLVAELAALGPDAILEFDRIWREHHARAYRWDLWGAAYVINGGCSDDCFDYFRDYLISLGRETYESALRDPESLADVDLPHDELDHELMSGIEFDAWERIRGDAPLPAGVVRQPSGPEGEPFDEDTVGDRFPRLAARFGH